MKPDDEIDEIIIFITDHLNKIKTQEHGGLKGFARKAKLLQKNLSDFSNKYGKGSNPHFRTVYKALKVILGRTPIELSTKSDCNIDPLLAVKIRRIQDSDYRELFDLLVDVLKDYEFADPGQLAVIKGALEAVRATVLARKSQPPAGPGEKLLNSAEK